MCGIFCYIGKSLSTIKLQDNFSRIENRGPDYSILQSVDNVTMGFHRLSINDLTNKGDQPFESSDGRFLFLFNGECYNYKDLRYKYLKQQRLQSDSDSEVVFHLFLKLGVDSFRYLRGMFAICIIDRVSHKVYLARDEFGIKPLYYWFNSKTLIFSSEIKGIIEHPDYQIDVDLNALNEYFSFQNIFSFQSSS